MPSALIQLDDISSQSEAVSAVKSAVESGAKLVALPGLCGISNAESEQALLESKAVIAALAEVAGEALITTSLVLPAEGGRQHCAVAIGASGLVAQQGQVHFSERFSWSVLSDGFTVAETEFGCLGLLCSDDSIYPEAFRLVAMQGADVVSVPLIPLERWELTTGLIERAAENRVNLLAAMQPSDLGVGFGAALHEDFTIFGEWKTRTFDGVLTRPMLTHANKSSAVTPVVLHPKNAENKVVSHRTHVIDNRPWHLLEPMLASAPNV
nr:carbon-nitrogen hydrolase family protein [Litorivivens lipolytica]